MAADPNSAWESVLRTDAAVQSLLADIREAVLALAAEGKAPSGPFDFDAYFSFVARWNEWKAGVDRRKTWFFYPIDTIDLCNDYWHKNGVWRGQAESKLGVAPQTGPALPPETPLPSNDPRRTQYPYEGTIRLGLVAALVLGVGYLVSKAS